MKYNEPWRVNKMVIYDAKGYLINEVCGDITEVVDDIATAARIVSCVNALAGIDDPEKWVADRKWRRVEDGLPEENTKVFVRLSKATHIGLIDSNNRWHIYYKDGCHEENFERPVTAWMPLPEPPKQ